ncbi:PREDICTED: uncharacterized protein LOC104595647 isoform X2 [Nelumbo nucifera]|uniref:Uncharacterized protein LOC104595647 isoform X2 n=1 Tax=Nelumbo nucifera TaxID=4432 RepID=A0A1U7ZL78_NELNU|nr:PREDICTED: uncharacterized protein LOC104595647 isoform X2 [Nelumbo nucifera]
MSDHVVQSFHDGDTKVRESLHPYQSVWMAHWMKTNCDSASRVHNHICPHNESKQEHHDTRQSPMPVETDEPKVTGSVVDVHPDNVLDHMNEWGREQGLKVESSVSQYGKRVEKITETGRVEMADEMVAMNLRNYRNASSTWQSFPIFNFDKKKEYILASKNNQPFNDRQPSRFQFNDNTGHVTAMDGRTESHFHSKMLELCTSGLECSSREYHLTEDISQISGKLVNSHKILEKKTFPAWRPLWGGHMESRYNIMPCDFKSVQMPLKSVGYKNEEIDQYSGLSSKENLKKSKLHHYETSNYGASSKFLICDKEMDNHPNARNSRYPYLEQKSEILKLPDPSITDLSPPFLIGKQGKKRNFPISGILPSHSSSAGESKLEELNYGYRSLHRTPSCSFNDVETLRICTTVDSVEGVPGGPSKFSQTTHHLLITKKTDVNMLKGGQIIRESMVSTKFKGSAFYELLTLPFNFGSHGKQKLEPLENSTYQEGKEDVEDAKTDSLVLKNESSDETDTMDMDVFHSRSSPPGEALHTSNKCVMVDHGPTKAEVKTASFKEIESIKAQTEVFDRSQEAPASSAAAGTMDNGGLSTSRTESLDVDYLLSHTEQPDDSIFSPQQESAQGLDPGNRWVKRLKPSASNSLAHDTKSSKLGDASSNVKVNKLFGTVMNYGRSTSEPILGKRFGKGQMESDKAVMLLTSGECSSMGLMKESWDLSHSWIQRWCRHHAVAPLMKPASTYVCEPHGSKAASEELERKQFPSIAAMALVGKAMSGFRPCEFRKRGSSVVWNTEGF